MKRCAGLLVLLTGLTAGAAAAKADEAAIIAEVNAAISALGQAFGRQDLAYIKANMTPDHISVVPYSDGPHSVAQQLALIPYLKVKETPESAPRVTVLGPNAAMRTAIVALEGTYKGEPLPPRVFVTVIMVKENGR
jgi:ketosteroid isomerase-like protein